MDNPGGPAILRVRTAVSHYLKSRLRDCSARCSREQVEDYVVWPIAALSDGAYYATSAQLHAEGQQH